MANYVVEEVIVGGEEISLTIRNFRRDTSLMIGRTWTTEVPTTMISVGEEREFFRGDFVVVKSINPPPPSYHASLILQKISGEAERTVRVTLINADDLEHLEQPHQGQRRFSHWRDGDRKLCTLVWENLETVPEEMFLRINVEILETRVIENNE